LQLQFLLAIPADTDVIFERFSDSAGSYIALDSNNPAIYKQLYRAAKAKLKLRIKATVVPRPSMPVPNIMDEQQPRHEPLQLPTPPKASPASRHSYLDTVLSAPPENDNNAPHLETSIIPTVSSFLSRRPAAVTSLGNTTNDVLVTPGKLEQPKAAAEEATPKLAAPRNSGPRGQEVLGGAFCIDCNNCGTSIPNEHYHCGICDDGDFDLCSSCVAADVTCDGDGHWLIKRRIQNGLLLSSVTETIAPKKWQEGRDTQDEHVDTSPAHYAPRYCNSCINGKIKRFISCGAAADGKVEVPGEELVTCTHCADYDLCMMCFSLGDHGHHPAHRFQPVGADSTNLSSRVLSLCEPGRGFAHPAICDGCDKVSEGGALYWQILLTVHAAHCWSPSQVFKLS
jgi:next to BRCA1 gene 1 protein